MDATLVMLAAGIGARYGGGVKQLAEVGPTGELIIDYSIHDALEAGFNKVVFIIRRDIYEDFRERIGRRIEAQFQKRNVKWEYAFQELENPPEGRKNPWGTGQALLSCKEVLHEPFAVINADDYYGKDADALELNTLVSMNFWLFPASFVEGLETGFAQFQAQLKEPLTEEYLLPIIVDGQLCEGACSVEVLAAVDSWFGITYAEDKHTVTDAFRALYEAGAYTILLCGNEIKENTAMPQYADTSGYTAEETLLRERMKEYQGGELFTNKGLPFTYEIRGNELFISRKDKAITRATVNTAYRRAQLLMEMEGCVSGPKKLGVFGASYLYPVFLALGILCGHVP